MRDRQKIEAILTRRFPGAPRHQVAAAVNAIMGLGEEWEEVVDVDGALDDDACVDVRHAGLLAHRLEVGADVRVFRRRDG